MDSNILSPWIIQYKKLISGQFEDKKYNEIYKWETIQHFQNNWTDDHAPKTISEVLKRSFNRENNNLWSGSHFLPYKMLLNFATKFPTETSKAFKHLFDESIDLFSRINKFITVTEELTRKYFPGKEFTSYQGKRSIMVYLTLRYPEKYYLYKHSMFSDFCELTKVMPKPGRSREDDNTILTTYMSMCDEIRKVLSNDKELIQLHRNLLPKNIVFSDNNHTITQDFIYCVTTYLNQTSATNNLQDPNVSYSPTSSPLKTFSSMPLNQILFGPPGTGKTYNTVNKALEILNENIEGIPREKVKAIFDSKIQEGQIVFTTFHQSMTYEDFIEGIKPLKPQPGEPLKYDLEKGLFKKLCETAQSNYDNSRKENQERLPFEEAFEKLQDEWEADPSMKFPVKTVGYEFTIIGFTNTSIQFRKASGGTGHTLSINTLKEQYYGKENFKQGVGTYYPGILNKLFSYKNETTRKADLLNYVLIIDEINRGNVSEVFGELITLLEEDKRQGQPEALRVTLPYSKESFSVPPNLYILGTMNTADRSVEALDTALRRRFTFQAILPDENLLSPQNLIIRLYAKYPETAWDNKTYRTEATRLYNLIGIDESFEADIRQDENPDYADDDKIKELEDDQFTGINLQAMLYVINRRLTALLTKDHTIGHAWLMNVYSLEDLQSAFKNKILPLLQEFFYNDYAKIGLVLGDAFVTQKLVGKNLFAGFKDTNQLAADYEDKVIYTLTDPVVIDMDGFKSIYE